MSCREDCVQIETHADGLQVLGVSFHNLLQFGLSASLQADRFEHQVGNSAS